MPIIVINGSVGNEIGLLQRADIVYETVTTAESADVLIVPTDVLIHTLGQEFAPNGYYYNKEHLQGFDLSQIPRDARIINATMSFNTINDDDYGKTAVIYGYKYDFGTKDVSDYISSSGFLGMSRCVQYAVPAPPLNQYVDFSDGVVPLKSVLVPGQMNRFIFTTAAFVNLTSPAQGTVSDLLRFNFANTPNPPRLTIEYEYPSVLFGANF